MIGTFLGRIALVGALVTGALSMVSAASAETLYFSWVGSYGPGQDATARWELDSDPTPAEIGLGDFVLAFEDGHQTLGAQSDVAPSGGFHDSSQGGGFFLESNLLENYDVGPQIFTGTLEAPHFSPGTYVGQYGTLTITAVPEPAAWALMMTGVAFVGGALRRRNRPVAPGAV